MPEKIISLTCPDFPTDKELKVKLVSWSSVRLIADNYAGDSASFLHRLKTNAPHIEHLILSGFSDVDESAIESFQSEWPGLSLSTTDCTYKGEYNPPAAKKTKKNQEQDKGRPLLGTLGAGLFSDGARANPGLLPGSGSLLGSVYVPADGGLARAVEQSLIEQRDDTQASDDGEFFAEWIERLAGGEAVDTVADILKDYNIYPQERNGNCLFEAVGDQVDGIDGNDCRFLLSSELIKHPGMYAAYVPALKDKTLSMSNEEKVEAYVARIQKNTEWGGELDCMGLANALNQPICVVVCSGDQSASSASSVWGGIRIQLHQPREDAGKHDDGADDDELGELIVVHYNGGNHYQPIVAKDDKVDTDVVLALLISVFSDADTQPSVGLARP